MRFTFAIVILGDSPTVVTDALRAGGFSLDEDRALRRGDDILGAARQVSLDELRAMSALPSVQEACAPRELPFAGYPVAAFVWTHAADESLARTELVPLLMRSARGTFVRLDDGRSRPSIALRTFHLDDLMKRYGFDDGDALLARRDEDYQRQIARAIEARLAEAGLDGTVGFFGTHHNPIGLSGELRRNGVVVADAESELAPLTVEMWAWNWPIVDDPTFWND